MSNKPEGFWVPYRVSSGECGVKFNGLKLLVFCIISQFSQGDAGCWYGTLEYLATWLGTTKKRICDVLTELTDEGYLIKGKGVFNGKERNTYVVNLEKNSISTGENLNQDTRDNLNENLEKNSSNNKSNNKRRNTLDKLSHPEESKEVLDYFNKVTNSNLNYTRNNLEHISGRLSDGYTIDDCKRVIDIKWATWGAKPYRFHDGNLSSKYLRPITLFAPRNFENYLIEANNTNTKVAGPLGSVSKRSYKMGEMLDIEY